MRTKTVKKATSRKAIEATPKVAVKCAKRTRKARAAAAAVVFTVHAERGKAVYLAGEFNDWNPTAKKMAYKARSGVYAASVRLAPGSYQYKFVVDGVWCADPENVNCVANDKGTFNSVVVVK